MGPSKKSISSVNPKDIVVQLMTDSLQLGDYKKKTIDENTYRSTAALLESRPQDESQNWVHTIAAERKMSRKKNKSTIKQLREKSQFQQGNETNRGYVLLRPSAITTLPLPKSEEMPDLRAVARRPIATYTLISL